MITIMFSPVNDQVSIDCRNRLFNIFVSHELKDMCKEPGIVTFEINLQDEDEVMGNNFSYDNLMDMIVDKNIMITEHQDELLKTKDIHQVVVCMLITGPQGSMNLSVWRFGKEAIADENKIILGDWPLTTKENPWYSEDILTANLELLIDNIDLLKKVDEFAFKNCVSVVILKEETLDFYRFREDELKDLYQNYLIAQDKYAIAKKAFTTNKNSLIFMMENYHIRYPLVINYYIDEGKYVWSVVST